MMSTIHEELPGPLPSNENCRRVESPVKYEKNLKPQPKMTTENLEKMKTQSSQTTIQMIDAMCQTVEYLKSTLQTLDAAVQTVELNFESNHKLEVCNDLKEPVTLKKNDTDLENNKTDKIQDLLESAMQNKVDNEYPCKLCKKTFSSLFSVKTHIFVSHQKFLRSEDAKTPDSSPKKASSKKGFKSKGAYLSRKKLTHRKQRPWCKHCWLRFPSRTKYQEHRREMHQDTLSSRERSISGMSEISVQSKLESSLSGKSEMEMDSSFLEQSLSDPCPSTMTSRSSTPAQDRLSGAATPAQLGRITPAPCAPTNEPQVEDEGMEDGEKAVRQASEDEDMEEDYEAEDLDEDERLELVRECTDPSRSLDIKLVRVDQVLGFQDEGSFSLTPPVADEDEPYIQTEDEGGVTEFCSTLPWYEGRYHHCLICEKFYPLGTFANHVVETHHMSMFLYREKFPSDDLSASLWSCSLCERSVKWTQPSIARHLKSNHSVSLQEYGASVLGSTKTTAKQLRSNSDLPWFESRNHKCRLCEKVFVFNQLQDHLRRKHCCSTSAYKAMFPKSCPELPQWKCMVCNGKIKWTKVPIQLHLGKHSLTLEEYEENYVAEMNTNSTLSNPLLPASSDCQDGDPSNTSDDVTDMIPASALECVIKEEPDDGPAPITTRIVKLEARESTPAKHMVKVGTDEKLWVPWFESKLHKCLICGEVRTCGLSFKNHIYDKHQYMSRKQYVKQYPSADIEPKPWNCALCRNSVKWTKKCIVDHLRSSHSMTREEFEVMFDMPAKHMVDAPEGGEYNFNARTDLGLANKTLSSKLGGSAAAAAASPIRCGLCEEEVDNLAEHIHNYHKMNESSYLKICPHDSEKFSSSDWTCKICEEKTANVEDSIKAHLKIHAIDIKDYEKTFDMVEGDVNGEDTKAGIKSEVKIKKEEDKIVSRKEINEENEKKKKSNVDDTKDKDEDFVPHRGSVETPWYETLKITCKECNNSFWLGQFMKHIILSHKLPIKVYKSKHPHTVIPKRQYICRICGIGVSHYASPISGHLTGRHNMTMTEYFEKYEKLKVSPPEQDKEPEPKMPEPPVVESEPSVSGYVVEDDNINLDNPNVKNQRMAQFQKSGKMPWYECKTTVCRFCNEEWLLGSFRRHLYDRHDKVSRTAYAEMFPDADISLPTWKCKICGNGIRWVRDNIFYHLRTHNFTMEGYRQVYIDGTVPPPSSTNSKPVPNLVPITANSNGEVSDKEKKFRCKLCNSLVAFESNAIKNHLKSFHNMSIQEYKPISQMKTISPAPAIKSEDAASNRPELSQPFNQSVFGQLMRPELKVTPSTQNLAVSSQVQATNSGPPWYNRCKWTCSLCNKAFSSGFWRHVQESHSLKKEDYLKQYGKGGIEIVHYFCKICDKKIPWSGASINSHTKSEHSMTLKEYEVKYAPKEEESDLVEQQPAVNVSAQSNVGVYNLPQLQYQVQQIHYVHSPNNWFNGCEYKCQICGRVLYSVAGLSMHLKETHIMDKYTYFRQYGRAGINIKKYRCKICLKQFPWSGVSISKHVKQAHNISLQKYSSMYENGSTTQSIEEEDVQAMEAESEPESSIHSAIKDKGDKWYNKCSWTCQVCGLTISTNSSAFYKHVVQDHGLHIDDYKEKYGNTGFVFVDHTCKLCKKKVPFNGLSMCKHLKHSHNMQLEEYEQRFMKDDDGTSTGNYYAPTDEFWYNKCMWKCQICGNKNKSLGSSKKHIHKVHNMPYEDYTFEYGTAGIYEVDFRCKICQATMSCNGVTIASHLLNNHKLTLAEYEQDYLKDGEGGEPADDLDQVQVPGLMEGEHFLAMKPVESAPVIREEGPRKDKPWYQKCKYFCQICNNPYFSISALRNHTKVKHNMDRDTYVSIYGLDAGKVIEDYVCKICNRTLKCEGRSLNAHMRNCHKMGILEYSRKYEADKNSDQDPNYYSETYQIEMDNGGGEDEDATRIADREQTESIGIDEDLDDSMDPLSNYVTTELNDEEYGEDDMTAEESMHFNFEEEEDTDQTVEITPKEVKYDVSQLDEEMETDQDGETDYQDENDSNIDLSNVSMGVIEFDAEENPLG